MELFKDTTIQQRVKTFFSHSLANDRLAHAYIFYGREGRGKEAFALELAKLLNCSDTGSKPCNKCPSCQKINSFNHPDIKYVFPLPAKTSQKNLADILHQKMRNPYLPVDFPGHKNISIDMIRELKNEAKYAPFEAKKRVFIIYGADYFSREAANSFLKLLEEPPDNLLLILITDHYHGLLDTIRSRCQPVYFPEFSMQEIKSILEPVETEDKNIEALIRISQFNIKKIFRILHSDYQQKRELVYRFFKSVAADNYLNISEIIDEITSRRDKNYVLEVLDLLILWLRDAMHFLVKGDAEDFVNPDFEEAIQKFAGFFSNSDFESIIELVENTYFQIQRNAHPALSLTNLSVEMHRLLALKKPIKEAV